MLCFISIHQTKNLFIILAILSLVAFITNPKHSDFQSKANEIWEQALNQEADNGGLVAKVARFFGAGKKGDWVLRVERHDYFLFSVADVFSTLENQHMGVLIGCFGQVYVI